MVKLSSRPILRDTRRSGKTLPHPEEAAQRPSLRMRHEVAEQHEVARGSKEGREEPDGHSPRNLGEFYAALVNATQAWRYCEHKACLRAKRCTALAAACFETHAETFREFMREKIAPCLRGEISLQSDSSLNGDDD